MAQCFPADVEKSIEQILRCQDLKNLTAIESISVYNKTLQKCVEMNFPTKKCLIKPQSKISWFTQKLKILRQERRKAERLWRKTKLSINFEIYKTASKKYNVQLVRNKKEYYAMKLLKCKGNTKDLFSITNSLLGKKKKRILPECDDDTQLSEKYSI